MSQTAKMIGIYQFVIQIHIHIIAVRLQSLELAITKDVT